MVPPAASNNLATQIDMHSRLGLDTHGAASSLLQPVHDAEDLDPQSLGRVLSALKKKRSHGGAVATIAWALESCPLIVNTAHWTLALKACRRANEWRTALDLLETMHESGHAPDLECYGVASAAAAASGTPQGVQASVALLRDAVSQGMLSGSMPRHCAPVLAALGKAGRGQCALDLFGELRAAGVTHDANSYSALGCALQEGGVPESALGVA